MRRWVAVGLAVALVAIGLVWLMLSEPETPGPELVAPIGEQPARSTRAADQGAARVPSDPAQNHPALVELTDAGPALPPLDCVKPAGEVLRVGRTTFSAAAFCKELLALAGPQPAPPAAAWHQQARLMRDRVVNAELVHQALADESAALDERELEAAMARLTPSPDAGTTARLANDSTLLRAQLKARLELNKLLSLRLPGGATDADLLAAYNREPAKYGEPARATVTPFVLRLTPSSTSEQVAAGQQKAEQFRAEVTGGSDPAGASKHAGMAAMPKFELEEGGGEAELTVAAFSLAPRQWSRPVRTVVGWVVVRTESVRPGVVLPFAQVREKVRASLLGRQGFEGQQQLLNELRASQPPVDLVSW